MADSRERIRVPSRDGRELQFTSHRQVLRRLMLLSEGRQYHEAAAVVEHLGLTVLTSVISELPMDLLLEHLPHSTYLLESFYKRLIKINPTTKLLMPTEAVLWQLVKLFSVPQNVHLKHRFTRLIHYLVQYEPKIKQILNDTHKTFNMVVQGLGVHGLIADTSGELISLYMALKRELHNHITTYKLTLSKLEELSTITVNPNPAYSSHQRLLAISYGDIQQRLIDNKTLLTILDKPNLKHLPQLLENLCQRVENDKNVLKCVGQVKRIDLQMNIDKKPAAGLLMNFARACELILNVMSYEPTTTNFLANSTITTTTNLTSSNLIASFRGTSSGSDGYHSDDSSNEEYDMVVEYRNLYLQHRSDTQEVLDNLPPLKHLQHLKVKITLSVIVLAFRYCHGWRERKVNEVRRSLDCPLDSTNETTLALDRSIRQYLHDTIAVFPLGEIERTIFNQLISTLYEYPCLKTCSQLLYFISVSVRLAWKMVNQKVPYYLDTDFTLGFLRPEKHERHHRADHRSDLIKLFIWPALMQNSRCLFKAIIAT